MKVFDIIYSSSERSEEEVTGLRFIADSALCNAGKPFFIPENEIEVEVALAPAIRLSRLGKTISANFAHRYYDGMAPCLKFSLPALKKELIDNGLPADAAYSFDKALIHGDFEEAESIKEAQDPFIIYLNGRVKGELKLDDLLIRTDELIAKISKLNTIKIGDILLPYKSIPFKARQGDVIDIIRRNICLLSVKIK